MSEQPTAAAPETSPTGASGQQENQQESRREVEGAPSTSTRFEDAMRTPAGSLGESMGIVVTSASPERVVATMPVAGNTQPYGLLHGGASVVLAESLGSIGAALHAGEDRIAVGVDINATHHRAARPGDDGAHQVTGVATAIHRGRSTASYEVVITDDAGRRVCTARITCQIMDAPPGA